ncbi:MULTISPECIES: HAD-IA family hydrolase [Pseudoalteromonas]|uniref:phosphoglycolate phosphatase n=1 Tax=Pseudoalteromonas ruthenica TaxID=151081 RepID=A0A5S3Z1Q2_9GAMM|nr:MULTISPECIES: HAD-IA family hydrolase [Pseudoalteromonas]MCG7567377.1 HAD-IA family hydrolase [Pseudoalteromonas sp. CnMc7-15]QFU05992.1 Phosphoglycolate phosphatase [Pseudoalteromonas sp. THAF3]TMO89112.1 phosphoglycolate phosphatase [Pseudoalteromonas ruthenica]TMP24927.1 phosphoglycolate phosphatase [Pseudoalteromonas ruthenica]TMP86128.1 phosphoglycolate phosphatase [Pseudoalteromonas ruthenica]
MKYQALLFDLDGTLVDSAEDMYIASNLMLTDLARPIVSQTMVRQFVGNGIEMLVKRLLSGDMAVNPHLSAADIERATSLFFSHYEAVVAEHSALYPHVETVLAAFAHIPKAVVTNKARRFTLPLLEKMAIARHFDVVVCGDDGDKKPAPTPLLSASEQLAVAPKDCLMIGDSKSDLLAAQAAAMDCLALTYGYHQGEDLRQYNPQYLCDQFLDIITTIN